MKLGDSAAGSAGATIACILASEPGPPAHRGALYRRAARLVSQACRTGPWDSLRELAVFARNDALAANPAPEVRRGALSLLGALEQPATALALVAAAAENGSIPPALEALLAAPGASTILAVAQRLAAGPPAAVLDQLRAAVLRLDPSSWRRAAEMSAALPDEAAIALVPLAAGLSRRLAREVLEKLAGHASAAVRAHAGAFLSSLRGEQPGTESGA